MRHPTCVCVAGANSVFVHSCVSHVLALTCHQARQCGLHVLQASHVTSGLPEPNPGKAVCFTRLPHTGFLVWRDCHRFKWVCCCFCATVPVGDSGEDANSVVEGNCIEKGHPPLMDTLLKRVIHFRGRPRGCGPSTLRDSDAGQ